MPYVFEDKPTITPTFARLNLEEVNALLQGLFLADMSQIRRGWPPILDALKVGSAGPGQRRLRYIRDDPDEFWETIRDIWAVGGGDCEDLAAAVAAELVVSGADEGARPMIYRVRPGLAHAVVRMSTGQIFDPSKVGGMGEGPHGAISGIHVIDGAIDG